MSDLLPDLRKRKRNKEKTIIIDRGLSVEQMIAAFQTYMEYGPPAKAEAYLTAIIYVTMPILKTRGLKWDPEAKTYIKDRICRFDIYGQIPFFDLLISDLDRITGRKIGTAEDRLQAECYDKTGPSAFRRENQSVEERLTLEHGKAITEGLRKD